MYCLVCWLLAGGVPGPGVVVEGVIEVKQDIKAARNIWNMRKNSRFPALIDFLKCQNTVFYLKVLNKIYS
jgi:hypothetical protein